MNRSPSILHFISKHWQHLFLLGLLHCSFSLVAQEVSLTRLGFEEGLSHRNVRCVQQDSSGFLWIGNDKGLNRYDGHEFLLWQQANPACTLPEGRLNQIGPVNKRHWLLLYDTLLVKFNPATATAKPLQFAPGDSLPEGRYHFNSLALGTHGELWLMAANWADSMAWLFYAPAEAPLRKIATLPLSAANKPMAAFNGKLYLQNVNNLISIIEKDGSSGQSYELPAPPSEPDFSTVQGFFRENEHRLWVFLKHGQVGWLDRETGYYHPHPVSDRLPPTFTPSALLPDQNGDLWLTGVVQVGTQNTGAPCSYIQPGSALFQYQTATDKLHDLSYYLKRALNFTTPPRQLFEDATGGIWICTEFGLVHLIQRNHFQHLLADGNDCCKDGVCSMRGITEDDAGNVYFSYYDGIHLLRRSTQTLEPLIPLKSQSLNNPFDLLWHQGFLWLGNGQRINLETMMSQTVVAQPRAAEGVLLLDHEGDIWYGCGNEILIFTGGNPQQAHAFIDTLQLPKDLRNAAVTFLFQSKNGRFWIGTAGHGAFEVEKNGRLLHHLTQKSTPALPHNRILGITQANGSIWFATAEGLAAFDEEKNEIRSFTTAEGLANNFINSILPEGDSAIWAGTDNGLSRLDLHTLRFANFFDSDGLTRNEFNRISCLRARDGRMYFGGLDGVNAFYPGPQLIRKFDAGARHVVLSKASWFNGDDQFRLFGNIDPARGLVLTHRDKMFSAWFSMTDFSNPEKQLYQYKLEGYDDNWSAPSPMNFARFFNLPAGQYTLRVKASAGGSNWLDSELAIPLQVKEAFYKTTWFLMLALAFLALASYGAARYRLRQARLKALKLEKQVQQRTKELASEKQKSEKLLLNILPPETAKELLATGTAKARRHEQVTVLFSDFKNFSKIAAKMSPEELVKEIDACFRAFDDIVGQYELEKIKTIGDAYLCAGGLKLGSNKVNPPREVACATLRAAMDMHRFLQQRAQQRKAAKLPYFEARIGIHTGALVAGIVGSRKFAFDIWGDTVNVAQRLEAAGKAHHINISKEMYQLIKEDFKCIPRGKIEVKNIGEVDMYFVDVNNSCPSTPPR